MRVEVVLLALRRERQLPRALLTGTDQRRTFHRRGLPTRFRRVAFRAHCVVDWAPRTTRRKNGQNEQPPCGALFLHIGVLHTLEEAPFE